MLITKSLILAADWAAAGTITVGYPAGVEGGHLSPANHKIAVKNGGVLLQGKDFALTTVGKASAVLTLAAGVATIPAGSELFVEFHLKGDRYDIDPNIINAQSYGNIGNRVSRRQVIEVNFGSPAAIDDDGICASQNRTGAGALLINGALASGGQVVLDVPRNVIADSGGADTAVITVTGYDEFGVLMKESLTLNGTTAVPGKKAFKRITAVESSATIANGFFLGTGDVLGFPVFLPNAVNVLYDTEDGAVVTDGTFVAGVLTKPTATTGDVRGTYDPNSACDGSKRFSVVMLCDDPTYLGAPQFAG